MRFKLDWDSLIVGRKFTIFSLFYFVFEGNFPSASPRAAYIWRGDLQEGFLRYWFRALYLEGLIHGGAYFRKFTVVLLQCTVYVRKPSYGGGTSHVHAAGVHHYRWHGTRMSNLSQATSGTPFSQERRGLLDYDFLG